MGDAVDLRGLSTRDLLRLYADILTVLEQPGAVDVTAAVKGALDALGTQPPATSTTSDLNTPREPGSVE